MRTRRLAVGAGVTLMAVIFGLPFVRDANSAAGTLLGLEDFICYGLHAPISASASQAAGARRNSATDNEHQHPAPAGLYMPMFSTPPVGGAVYNGPPLDEC